jgi:hypothetical protein
MKEKEKNPVLETADQAMKNYEQALRTGLRFQEEAWQCWSAMLNQSASNQEWQKYVSNATATANGVLPATQKRMEEAMELMEKNTKAGVDLIKKAVDAAQASGYAEGQAKWMEFWKASLGLARFNAENAMLMSSRAVDSWMNLVQKNSDFVQNRTTAKAV